MQLDDREVFLFTRIFEQKKIWVIFGFCSINLIQVNNLKKKIKTFVQVSEKMLFFNKQALNKHFRIIISSIT